MSTYIHCDALRSMLYNCDNTIKHETHEIENIKNKLQHETCKGCIALNIIDLRLTQIYKILLATFRVWIIARNTNMALQEKDIFKQVYTSSLAKMSELYEDCREKSFCDDGNYLQLGKLCKYIYTGAKMMMEFVDNHNCCLKNV